MAKDINEYAKQNEIDRFRQRMDSLNRGKVTRTEEYNEAIEMLDDEIELCEYYIDALKNHKPKA